jgi:hypothetical protein
MRRTLRVGLLVTTASALAVGVAAAPAAYATTPANPAGPVTVLLPTGDRVQLSTAAGRPRVLVLHQSGIQGYRVESSGADTYVIPTLAEPFLGSLLDRSLFDATALAKQAAGTTFPVTVSTTSRAAAVPGMTVTARTATTQSGYLTATGMTRFRAALTTVWKKVTQPGARMPASFFGGVTHISGAGVAPGANPEFPQVTLIVKVLDTTGGPAAGGEVALTNVDDARKFTAFGGYANGEGRFSVPLGHYSGLVDLFSYNPKTGQIADRFVPLGQFTVSGNDQTVVFDGRKATSRISVRTPRPAAMQDLDVEFDRFDPQGGGMGDSTSYGPGSSVYVAPTTAPTIGTMHWLVGWSLDSTPGSAAPYTYDLTFDDANGIPANQATTVAAFQVATVKARYYTDTVPRAAQFGRGPLYPFQFVAFGTLSPLATPVSRTEYVYAAPSVIWFASLIGNSSDFQNPFIDVINDDVRSYPAGSTATADWQRGPLAPGIPAQTPADTFYVCGACRTADRMAIYTAPVLDTTPGHYGFVNPSADGKPPARFAVYRNGSLIASGSGLARGSGGEFAVPAGSGAYRLHLAVDRSGDLALTSTSTVTDLGFVSSATSGAPLPAGWNCPINPATGCAVLPLLAAQVPLPTDLTDHLPIGTSRFLLTIAPVQGAAPTTITAAAVAVSLDGKTFRNATLTRVGNGRYQVSITDPASWAGHTVTLRVSGTAANGSNITQTTTAAYAVADS